MHNFVILDDLQRGFRLDRDRLLIYNLGVNFVCEKYNDVAFGRHLCFEKVDVKLDRGCN